MALKITLLVDTNPSIDGYSKEDWERQCAEAIMDSAEPLESFLENRFTATVELIPDVPST